MEVAHGGFERIVAQHDLEIPNEGAVLQGMGGKSMAQMMRRDAIELATVGRLFDGSLNIGFVTAPAHDLVGSGMPTGGSGGEEPSPTFGMGGVGIFLVQKIGQGDRDVLGLIRCREGLGDFKLFRQGSRKAVWEADDPAFFTFGLLDIEPRLSQIEVFDAEI